MEQDLAKLMSNRIHLLSTSIIFLMIFNLTILESVDPTWQNSNNNSIVTNKQIGTVDALKQEKPSSRLATLRSSAINISISVSPKRAYPIGGLAAPIYGNITCTWWIEGFPLRTLLMSSIHYLVNFTVTSPSGVKLKEVIYYWPEGIGNKTHPITQVYQVPVAADDGLYECKVELYSGSDPPYKEKADNSDCFGVGVTPPDFNFDLILTPLCPYDGMNATSISTGQQDTIVKDILNITVALKSGTPDYVGLTCNLLTPEPTLIMELSKYRGVPTFNSTVRVTASGHSLGSFLLEITAKITIVIPAQDGRKEITTQVLRTRRYELRIYSAPIFDFTPHSGSYETIMTIYGYGLNEAYVYLNDQLVLVNAKAQKTQRGEELLVHIHQNLPLGNYKVTVQTPYGSATHQTDFVIVDPAKMAITGQILYEDENQSMKFKPARLCIIT
ncbi:MAG: hypothetical protein QG670_2048, partial [Thermoproteota archaeon]|nr:hypothetical protein [Thermoproteota archaeon]